MRNKLLTCAISAALAGLVGAALPAQPARAEDAERVPVPTTQALADAEKLVKDVYKEDYAKRGPDERRALAEKLLDEGRNNKSDPASQYVLLREARDAAIQVADVPTAMDAISEMSKAFKVDPVDVELTAFTNLRNSAHTVDAMSEAAEASLKLIDEAMAAENFDAASKAADLAVTFGTGAKNMSLISQVQARKADIKTASAAYLAMKIGSEKLKKDPKDAAAKFDVGSFLALYKNDWDHGLQLLAEGSDVAFAAAAKGDLAGPVDVGGMLKVADAWWDLANARPTKARILQRAEFWYSLVSQNADGLIKQKADKRLESIAESKPANLPGTDGSVTEVTRKALPTSTEISNLKSLEKEWRVNSAKQQELMLLKQTLLNRLVTNVTQVSTADYFARLKADIALRKIFQESNDTMFVPSQPLVQFFDAFAQTSKNKDEFAARLVMFERVVGSDKTIADPTFVDNIIYSTVRNYIVRNQQALFPTREKRSEFCSWLMKSKGVKSAGLVRYKTYVDTNRFAP